jgi:hypothetical protein
LSDSLVKATFVLCEVVRNFADCAFSRSLFFFRISSLANIDDRIVSALRLIREKRWSYVHGTSPDPNPVSLLAQDLGYPAQLGDPKLLPAHGGHVANTVWNVLGVQGRGSVGGIPCEIVHGAVTGGSCTANFMIRGVHAFLEALALYVPVSRDDRSSSEPVVIRFSGSRPAYIDQAAPNTPQFPVYPRHTFRDPPQRLIPFRLRLFILGRRVFHSYSRCCASAA